MTYRTFTIIQQINFANYCGAKRYFRFRGFSIAGASAAPVAPAVPTPMTLATTVGDGKGSCEQNAVAAFKPQRKFTTYV